MWIIYGLTLSYHSTVPAFLMVDVDYLGVTLSYNSTVPAFLMVDVDYLWSNIVISFHGTTLSDG